VIGRGTAVKVYFPHAATERPIEAPPEKPVRFPVRREHVLLVEDDEALRKYLRHILECDGYTVTTAEGPQEALALTASLDPSLRLVISDVLMPGMSGPDLVSQLLLQRPGLAAMYMSGLYPAPIGTPAGTWPADLLQKPFSSDDLLVKVRQVLSTS
jgi:two-component system, cell cycle sensor histidine kinase and response regulator CckA